MLGADETLRGVVPFFTGRAVHPVSPESLIGPGSTLPLMILRQEEKRGMSALPVLDSQHTLLRQTALGNYRLLALWERL